MKRQTLAFQRFLSVTPLILFLAALVAQVTIGSVAPVQAKPAFSTIAIDARSGKVLYSRYADSPRYPASLTKVMTLYLLFEDLQNGKVTLNSKLKVSKHASRQAPSKLGLKPGSTIRVRDAIGALVTKSANDVAVVVAENLAGSVPQFAERMTRKARGIGMTRTTFRNPSGLPDAKQKTTARDMATLALRVQRDFPTYYKHFGTRTFKYGKRRYRNHNRLLGRVKGVDGIKTGYTRASGFNLTTSARRNGKRVVAVVMGGKTGRSRNAYMRRLIERMFRTKRLTKGKHLALVAGTPPGYTKPTRVASASSVAAPTTPPVPRVKPGIATSEIAGMAAAAAVLSPAEQSPGTTVITKQQPDAAGATFVAVDVTTNKPPKMDASTPEAQQLAELFKGTTQDSEKSEPAPQKTTIDSSSGSAAIAALAEVGTASPDKKPSAPAKKDALKEHLSSWNIQIGAFPTLEGATGRLESAQKHAKRSLIGKKPFTMQTRKGGETLYRARFSGFDHKSAAVKACKALSRKGVSCFTLAPSG